MAIVMFKSAPKKAVKKAVKKVAKKTVKKTVKKVSKMGRRAAVLAGTKEKTKTGLKKVDLMKNKRGKVVTKKQNTAGKKSFANIKSWLAATQKARKALNIKGFCAIGGKTALGKSFLAKAREIHSQM